MNVVVLRGKLSRAPDERALESGARLVRYEVTTRDEEGTADTTPVAWINAPAGAVRFDAGEEVVVVGRVRRRWFRRGPATESRVEVAADAVVSARSRKRVEAAIESALTTLGGPGP
jgi:single-strand DNA-binding protein